MKIFDETFKVPTGDRNAMIDITSQVQQVVSDSGITSGDVIVFCPHTTGAITINENADPDVVHDILLTLGKHFPKNAMGYRHSEGNSDSHVKSSLTGCSEQLLINKGKLILGTWQSVYFCEFDGPRTRTVVVQVRGL